jgi:ArsR family metal-binding transcriptional regulator
MFWNILARSSSGPGRRPFTAETRVRFPYGSQLKTKIKDMANHKSALKRIRQTAKRAAHNRYYHKTTRNAVRKLRVGWIACDRGCPHSPCRLCVYSEFGVAIDHSS